jgi:hypothetical protein
LKKNKWKLQWKKRRRELKSSNAMREAFVHQNREKLVEDLDKMSRRED